MAKRITYGIYRWIYYLMLIIVSITFVVVMIAIPSTVALAIVIRRMRNILKRKRAFWQNIDPMINKMKERLRQAANKKKEHERKQREKAIMEARQDIALLKGYNVNPLRK